MILLLGTLFILLILRVPVSFSLLISSVLYLITHDIPPVAAIVRMAMGVGDSFPLLAVPFFILAGSIMNSGGITRRLFTFADTVVGHITGGLGHANILASIIFSGMSGTAIADAGGLGAVELQAMREAGYDEDFSLAVTGASSLIGPIIPPSVPAVVFGVIAGVSIGRLFVAGFIPGVIMGLVMSIFVYFQSKHRGYPKNQRATFRKLMQALKESFFALLTPVVIIGGILVGVFTPTEAAIIAVVYSLILGFAYREITWKDIPRCLKETADNTVSVMLIVACASIFGWILASAQIPQKLSLLFLAYVPNKYLALLLINIFLLIAGTFMETISALTILTPVLMPVVNGLGIDPVHFGIIMILNLMIGLLTPPVGMVLYVLAGVSRVAFEDIAKAVVPYLIVLIITLLIFTYIPQIVLFLPNLVFD
ncbi:MAG: TRAP transporter large permease [Candidatus Vecturithrix sp.]|jgi:tripartite ATP-independent transporter DctM subunit|nr:TRAP transporter large permease [Candidatus Vecturithrix sp.]